MDELLADRLPATIELVMVSAVMALLLGVPMGVYTGLNRHSWLSRVFLTVSLVGISLPTFVIGILMILVFGVWLGLAADLRPRRRRSISAAGKPAC